MLRGIHMHARISAPGAFYFISTVRKRNGSDLISSVLTSVVIATGGLPQINLGNVSFLQAPDLHDTLRH